MANHHFIINLCGKSIMTSGKCTTSWQTYYQLRDTTYGKSIYYCFSHGLLMVRVDTNHLIVLALLATFVIKSKIQHQPVNQQTRKTLMTMKIH